MAVQDKTSVKLLNPFEFSAAQSTGKGLPYSELIKAYTDILKQSGDPEALKEFGAKSALGQAMDIYESLDPNASADSFKDQNKLARSAIANIRTLDPLKTERFYAVPESADDTVGTDNRNRDLFTLEGPKGQRQLVASTKKEVGDRIAALKSMYKKDVTLQKLKEKQGTDFISDADMNKIITSKEKNGDNFNDDSLMAKLPFSGMLPVAPEGLSFGEDSPRDKYKNDIIRDREIYNFPENVIDKDDSVGAIKKLKNKQEYQEGIHPIDFLLKFTPLSPFAVAAEQGEPLSRGAAGGLVSSAGTVGGAAASPFISPWGGGAIAGAANALGDEIARGERPDELTAEELAESYLVPAFIGGAAGGVLSGAGAKIADKFKKKSLLKQRDKASQEYDQAKADLEHMNRNTLNGETYDYNSPNKNTEAEEATMRVLGSLKDPSKIGEADLDNLILNPDRVEKIREAMAIQNKAIENDELRTSLLKRLNTDPEFTATVRKILGPNTVEDKYTVDGFDDLVRIAGGGNTKKFITPDIWEDVANFKARPAPDIVASRPIRDGLKLPETVEQIVYGARGYDPLGKGALFDTQPQYDVQNTWKEKAGYIGNMIRKKAFPMDPKGLKLLEDSFVAQYGSDDIGFARSVSNQIGAIVAEATDGINKGTMSADKLQNLASEYASWLMPPNSSPAVEDYLKRMFLFRVKSYINEGTDGGELVPGFTYGNKVRSSVNEVNNRGLDAIRLAKNTDRSLGSSNLTDDKLGRLSFNQLRDMYPNPKNGAPRTSDEFFNTMLTGLQQNSAKAREGFVNPEGTFAYLGGLERPSKEALDVFHGKKNNAHWKNTLLPKLKEVLSNAEVADKAQVDEQKRLLEALAAIKEDASKKAVEPLSTAGKQALAVPGFLGTVASNNYSNYGLTEPEKKTQLEEYNADRPYQYSYEKLRAMPFYRKILPPKLKESRKRGNFMPYRFVYPFQK